MFRIALWRREWDSNPRCLAARRFSRPFRYDHFGISPCGTRIIITHFSLLVNGFCAKFRKKRIPMSRIASTAGHG